MIGGAMFFIPGAQPVAAVLLGVSVVAGVASLAVEYWPTPASATTSVDTSLRLPTLPVTNMPSPTPQVAPTPPTQNVSGGGE